MHSIQPVNTVLHDIRSFLDTHGHPVPAWSPAQTPLEALYRLLRDRRGDDALWSDLNALTRAVAEARLRPDHALDAADVSDLLAELRHALEESPGRDPLPLRRWAATAPIAALSGFLLLGAAMGCTTPGNDDDDDDDSAVAEQACQEAIDHEIPQAEQDVFCQLVDLIEGASVGDGTREQLMECLPELSAEQREELLDAFVAASDEELAGLLEDAAFSQLCGWDGDDDDDTVNDH